MITTATNVVRLEFAKDVDQMVSVYSDAVIGPVSVTPGTVVKLFVYQYTNGNAVSFSGFQFAGGVDPVLGSNAGSNITVYFMAIAANTLVEVSREVVTA